MARNFQCTNCDETFEESSFKDDAGTAVEIECPNCGTFMIPQLEPEPDDSELDLDEFIDRDED